MLGRGSAAASRPILAGPSMVLGSDFSPRRLSMGDSRQEGSPLAPAGVVEAVGVAPEGELLVCYGPPKRGLPASKQTLSRWIVDAINIAYESSDLPLPMGVKAHSTRSVAASKASLYRTSAMLQDGLRP